MLRNVIRIKRKRLVLLLKRHKEIVVIVFAVVLGGLFLYGCSPKTIVNTQVPNNTPPMDTPSDTPQNTPQITPQDTPTPVPVAAVPTPIPQGSYVVKAGDCLWSIAGRSGIYSDCLEWPLLFKANRDRIQDPDLIYPREVLAVDRNITAEERTQARKEASDTPKYVPHTRPRSVFPVDYF
jgi:hypothetical protein